MLDPHSVFAVEKKSEQLNPVLEKTLSTLSHLTWKGGTGAIMEAMAGKAAVSGCSRLVFTKQLLFDSVSSSTVGLILTLSD